MKKILALFALVASVLSSCNSSKKLLPNVSGKAGEVIVVLDKPNWESDLGNGLRTILGGDCPYLAQKEPLYSLVNVTPGGFVDMFKVHRNIILFNVKENVENEGIIYRNDVWAHPQSIIQISAKSGEKALEIFNENNVRILSTLEQAERDRIIENSKMYEDVTIANRVRETFGGSPHFPTGYRIKKVTDDFIWVADEKQYTNQGIFVYRYPASETENFTRENIIYHRNDMLQKNVPGMFDQTWMTTSTYITPTVEFIRFRGRQFAQTRGFWEVHNDFMGGPFVSHSFYSLDNKYITVVEGFVYAPKYDKRLLLRQVESIIYSFEWERKNNTSEQN